MADALTRTTISLWVALCLASHLGCACREVTRRAQPETTATNAPHVSAPHREVVTAVERPKEKAAPSTGEAATLPASSVEIAAIGTRSRDDGQRVNEANPLAPTAPPTRNPRKCRVLAIGDSLTDRKSGGGLYLTSVERACGCTVDNLGKGGDMVNQMKPRLLAHLDASSTPYDYVIVFGGVNDLYSDETAHRSNARIERDLEAMYRAARTHGARVVAITVAPWGGFRRWFTTKRGENTRELNEWIRQSPSRGTVDLVVDAYPLLSCGSPERLCDRFARPYRDGLHFGPEGHQKLGLALVAAMGAERCPSASPTGGSERPKAP